LVAVDGFPLTLIRIADQGSGIHEARRRLNQAGLRYNTIYTFTVLYSRNEE